MGSSRSSGGRAEAAKAAREQAGHPAPPATSTGDHGSGQSPQTRSVADGRLPLWQRRANALRQSGTVPRDMFTRDVSRVRCNKCGNQFNAKTREGQWLCPHLGPHVRFLWMGDRMWERKLGITGYNYAIWQPVTEKVLQELDVSVDVTARTSEGVPRWGSDLFLVWAPEDIAKQYDELCAEGSRANEMLMRRQQELAGEMVTASDLGVTDGTGPIGDISVQRGGLGDFREFQQAREEQAREGREREGSEVPIVGPPE